MIALLISFTVFTSYITYIRVKYGPIKSVSESFYRIQHKAIFTLVLWFFAVPIAIASNSLIMFFAVAGICFVGAAPAFKSTEMEMRVHMIGAVSGIVLGMTSLVVEHGLWLWVASYAGLFIGIMFGKARNKTWWIEVAAFYYILSGLLISKL